MLCMAGEAHLPDGDIAEGQTETHHDLFQHFAKDLSMRRRTLGYGERMLPVCSKLDQCGEEYVLMFCLN